MTNLAQHLSMNLNDIADMNRISANSQLDEKLRGQLGQFMSSPAVSTLLADMFENTNGEQRLLDAGAGVGSLTAAFVERFKHSATTIESTCFEISEVMHDYLIDTLNQCEVACLNNGIKWVNKIISEDFIKKSVEYLLSDEFIPLYNKVILNPPYLKILSNGPERSELRKINFETSNLYSAFVGLSIKMIEEGGELVAITPRSFCNGPYFNEFRKILLDNCSLNKIHVFNSRSSAFKSDKVLQENVVYHLTKGEIQREKVIIVSSSCADDKNPFVYEVPFDEIVSNNNPDRFIHIITNEEEKEIAKMIGSLPCSLENLGVKASTGKVVDFRTKENLRFDVVDGSVPLIFPQHLKNGGVHWPLENSKKQNAIMNNTNTSNMLVKNGTYILIRRLTAKEEKRRIAASLYTSDISTSDVVGFENKTNYIHAMGEPLDDNLAKGLWFFLNSSFVDRYFRQMNGNTQVNATDLRTIRYPTKDKILSMSEYSLPTEPDQEYIDNIVSNFI